MSQKRCFTHLKFRLVKVPYHVIMKTEIEPDDKRLFDQFRSGGMDPDGAFIAVQEIRKMAGQNILAKMDAQTAELQAQSAELRAQGAKQSEQLRLQVEELRTQGADQSKQLQTEIAKLQAETKYIRWFLSTSIIFAALVVAISQLYLAGQ